MNFIIILEYSLRNNKEFLKTGNFMDNVYFFQKCRTSFGEYVEKLFLLCFNEGKEFIIQREKNGGQA